MYGTVAHMKAKPGQEKALAAMMDEWSKSRGSKVKGAVAGYLYKLDKNSNEMIMGGCFSRQEQLCGQCERPRAGQMVPADARPAHGRSGLGRRRDYRRRFQPIGPIGSSSGKARRASLPGGPMPFLAWRM